MLGSAAVVVALLAPAPVVAAVAVEPKEAGVVAGAAEDVGAGAVPPNREAPVEVDAGAPVVLGAKRDGAGVEEDAVAVVVAVPPPKREVEAGAEEAGVDVDVVEGAAEAVGKRDAGFEVGAAVLAGVAPPSPPNRPPPAGAVVAGVLAAGAVVVAEGFVPKSEGAAVVVVVVAGVDSAGLEVAAPPPNKVLDGAAVVLAENRPPAGFGADAALLNRLGVEVLGADEAGGVVVEPPKRPPGF